MDVAFSFGFLLLVPQSMSKHMLSLINFSLQSQHFPYLSFIYEQTSAFEGSVFTHSDVKPGMVVKAKVIAVDSFGAIVQFSSGVKALCPLRHMSEFEIVKPRKKFQVFQNNMLVFFLFFFIFISLVLTCRELLISFAGRSRISLSYSWLQVKEDYCYTQENTSMAL